MTDMFLDQEGQKPSLLSNNPFRNKQSPNSPTSPLTRTISNNPFLDSAEVGAPPTTTTSVNQTDMSPVQAAVTEDTNELFQTLSLTDRTHSPRRAPPPPTNGTRRPENVPLRPFAKMSPPSHRHTPSDEDKRRKQLRSAKGPPGSKELDIFADPPGETRPPWGRPTRRNSESSVRDKKGETEEDKKRRERRAREKRYGKPKLDNRKLDVIDKLDVTSIYGMGLFHHDGPFDACNPHRNRKGSKQAPMQAFPKDSRNMQLGGSGPNNSRLNLDQIHGTGQEAHIDFNAAIDETDAIRRPPPPIRSASFNPLDRTEPLHGAESAGLGTSTFLEGAPASRQAIQRTESEMEQEAAAGGISRKKSIAQRIGVGRQKSVTPFHGPDDDEEDVLAKKLRLQNSWKTPHKTLGNTNAPQKYVKEARRSLEEKRLSQEEPQPPVEGPRPLEPTRPAEEPRRGGFLSRVKSMKGGRK